MVHTYPRASARARYFPEGKGRPGPKSAGSPQHASEPSTLSPHVWYAPALSTTCLSSGFSVPDSLTLPHAMPSAANATGQNLVSLTAHPVHGCKTGSMHTNGVQL